MKDAEHSKTELHPTGLELYQLCPQKYYFQQEKVVAPRKVPIAMMKGTVLHRWLSLYGTHLTDPDAIPLDALRPMAFDVADEYGAGDQERAELLAELIDLEPQAAGVVNYIHEHGAKIIMTEYEIHYKVAGHSFSGTIDSIWRLQDTPEGKCEIIDYKSGRKWADASINRKLQFGHYYIACGSLGLRVNRVFWAKTTDVVPYKRDSKYGKAGDPRGQFLYPVFITQGDVERVTEWTRQIAGAIETRTFYPNPYGPCPSCEYNHVCPRYEIGVAESDLATRQSDVVEAEQRKLEEELFGDA